MNSSLESFRREFPITEKYLYLDHAGIAPISLRVKAAVERQLSEASRGAAFHYAEWADLVTRARTNCARLVNAEPGEIAFIRSTSHGLSIVASGLDWREGDNAIFFEKEFPSNIHPWLNLQGRGVEARSVSSKDGKFTPGDIESLIDGRTRLVSISSVQFVNGFRADLEAIGALCRKRGVLFCVDAIQSLGVLSMDVKKYKIDFLAADAHKWMLGPEGIGIFYCRKGLAERIAPPLVGWKSVRNELDFERPRFELKTDALRFEEGSLNLMGIAGLNAALELLFEAGIGNIANRVLGLGGLIISEAEARGDQVLTPREQGERGGSVAFAGEFEPLRLRDSLRGEGIMVNVRGGGLRISPHFYTTEEEIRMLFAAIDRLAGA